MMSWELLSLPIFERLAVALVHFLWQGAAIAAVIALLLRRLSPRAPHLRYGLLSAGMVFMAASPLFTFWLTQTGPTATSGPLLNTPVQATAGDQSENQPALGHTGSILVPSAQSSASNVSAPRMANDPIHTKWTYDIWLTTARPWLLLAWLCGVLLLGARLVVGYAAVRWLMRSQQPVSTRLVKITRTMSQRIGLHRVPIVAGCEQVADAMVVGFLRPMILLPAAWCTQLSPDVLEAVIAHELAHIRRWDLWGNLAQRLVETALFYHPAVWWLSWRLHAERELCCDAVAVAATGERLRYVEALATVANAGSRRTPLLLTANMGGKQMALLNRVRHILGRTSRERYLGHWSTGVMVLAIPLGLWLAAATMIPAAADEADSPRKISPETRRADRDRDRARPAPPRYRDRDRGGRADDRDRPRRDGLRRDRRRDDHPHGDRPHDRRPEGDRPPRRGFGPHRDRDGDRDRRPRDGRPGERPGPEQLIRLIQELREEVRQLRREVHELRGRRRPDGVRGPDGPRPPRGEGEDDDFGPRRRDRDREGDRGPRRFGDRGPHRHPPFEGRGRRDAHKPGDGPPQKRPPPGLCASRRPRPSNGG